MMALASASVLSAGYNKPLPEGSMISFMASTSEAIMAFCISMASSGFRGEIT